MRTTGGAAIPQATSRKPVVVNKIPVPCPDVAVAQPAPPIPPELGSAHAAGPELHADPRPDRLGRLGDGMLPCALAAAAHDQQVAVPDLEPQRRATPGLPAASRAHSRAQQQGPRRA